MVEREGEVVQRGGGERGRVLLLPLPPPPPPPPPPPRSSLAATLHSATLIPHTFHTTGGWVICVVWRRVVWRLGDVAACC